MGWNWDAPSAVAAILSTPLVGWVFLKSYRQFRMWLRDRERKEKLYDSVEKMALIFQPVQGPSLAETLQIMASTNNQMMLDMKDLKVRQETSISRQWAFMANTRRAIFETDEGGNYARANPALLSLCGRTMEDLRGRGWELMVAPAERKGVTDEWRAAVEAKRPYEAEYTMRHHDGTLFRVSCVATPLFCDTMKIKGYLGEFSRLEVGH